MLGEARWLGVRALASRCLCELLPGTLPVALRSESGSSSVQEEEARASPLSLLRPHAGCYGVPRWLLWGPTLAVLSPCPHGRKNSDEK